METRFEFGKNWNGFVKKYYNEERLAASQKHLLQFLEVTDLKGRSFLDVGCGSGLHSLAAFRAGAERIISFDLDEWSVHATTYLRSTVGDPDKWTVYNGSILDKTFLINLGRADIVYSWGVLHHTGNMWQALENTLGLVKERGRLYIAIYDREVIKPSGEYWLEIKQAYNSSGFLGKRLKEVKYIWDFELAHRPWLLPAFLRKLREQRMRGMAFYPDLKDWLGGYPFEFASTEQIKSFCEEGKELKLVKVICGEANAEYLFSAELSR
ncbi:MAG: class I SAM-dependent methyltransferase [Candidatus Omnitrophica bacterium]|nr:class I SAM-dependent methyltransferase [Candidatus Omnitrophota bacterium]